MQLFLCELMVQTFSQSTLFFKSFMPDILIFDKSVLLPPYHGARYGTKIKQSFEQVPNLALAPCSCSTGGAKHDVRSVRFVMDNILKLSVLFPLDGNKHERQLNLKSLLYG